MTNYIHNIQRGHYRFHLRQKHVSFQQRLFGGIRQSGESVPSAPYFMEAMQVKRLLMDPPIALDTLCTQ